MLAQDSLDGNPNPFIHSLTGGYYTTERPWQIYFYLAFQSSSYAYIEY